MSDKEDNVQSVSDDEEYDVRSEDDVKSVSEDDVKSVSEDDVQSVSEEEEDDVQSVSEKEEDDVQSASEYEGQQAAHSEQEMVDVQQAAHSEQEMADVQQAAHSEQEMTKKQESSDNKKIVSSTLDEYIKNGLSSAEADEKSRSLGLLAFSAKSGNSEALFVLSLNILRGRGVPKDKKLAKAFLTYLSETFPESYGVGDLELARIHRDEETFTKAEQYYVSADWNGCGPALPELVEMRKNPKYRPQFLLDTVLEEDCITKARENMRLRKFQDANRFLHRAILCGSTKAVDFLNDMRTQMDHANLYY
jgi:hypothetical protein